MPFKRYTYNGVEVQATGRRASTRDDKKYMREVQQDGKTYLVHYGDPDMPMRRSNEDRQEAFVARHNCSEKKDPTAPGFWACYDWENVNEKSVDMETVGSAVKALEDNRIGFYAVLFDRVDLQGERFTKSTDFGMQEQIPVLYQHGQDPTLKARSLGVAQVVRRDDVGLWMEAQLDLRDEYEKAIMQMVKDGKLGVSTGALSHIVAREGGVIKTWWLGEVSLTPIPAEPATQAVALKENVVQSEHETTEAIPEAHHARVAVVNDEPSYISSDEDTTMTDARIDALEDQVKTVGSGLERILSLLENEPTVAKSGFISTDGMGVDKNIKNIADFFVSVARRDQKSLAKYYSEAELKDMTSLTGSAGAFLLPEEYRNQLFQIALQDSMILPLCSAINVSVRSGYVPALDYSSAPSNVYSSALNAGMTVTPRAYSSTATETNLAFRRIHFEANPISADVDVENELIMDSPMSIPDIIRMKASTTVRSALEGGVLRGDGVGRALGVLNADALIDVSPDTNNVFVLADASEMMSRLYPQYNPATTRFVANPLMQTDILQLTLGDSSALGTTTINGRLVHTIHNIPVIYSEHLPAPDASGCVMLVDFSMYARFIRSGVTVETVNYANATRVTRFLIDVREDGKPMLNSAITLADGTSTVSPFVNFND